MLCLEHLPNDCLLVILGFLRPSKLHQIRLLNKRFYLLTQDDRLWKKIYQETFAQDILTEQNGKQILSLESSPMRKMGKSEDESDLGAENNHKNRPIDTKEVLYHF